MTDKPKLQTHRISPSSDVGLFARTVSAAVSEVTKSYPDLSGQEIVGVMARITAIAIVAGVDGTGQTEKQVRKIAETMLRQLAVRNIDMTLQEYRDMKRGEE